MSRFTGPLTLTHLDVDWRRWRLETPLTYAVGSKNSFSTIIVPAGFVTDGASVPQPLWAILPAWGRYSRAAVLHDFLVAALRSGAPHPHAPKRRIADRIFLEAMKVCGVHWYVRWPMYAAVRLAGMVKP